MKPKTDKRRIAKFSEETTRAIENIQDADPYRPSFSQVAEALVRSKLNLKDSREKRKAAA